MATERVGDMTLEELKEFIREVVRDELRMGNRLETERSAEEILAVVRRRLQTSPSIPSSFEETSDD